MPTRAVIAALAICLPAAALAVGSDRDDPPEPTPTTTECPEGQVFDTTAGACVAIEDSRLDDDALYRAARELAYAGRHGDALAVLARMSDQGESRVETYRGFIARSTGDTAAARVHYAHALAADPGNALARSYLGMAHVLDGRIDLARVQLAEIRARGGANTWPDRALARAIRTGTVTNY
ncbi:tetratricopeptide repeat protein [Rhodobacterales bacterium HKCCE2091]|nr:tetratricopeptide repeat protein [Rhodobacterales bacterium HKCCE2091]